MGTEAEVLELDADTEAILTRKQRRTERQRKIGRYLSTTAQLFAVLAAAFSVLQIVFLYLGKQPSAVGFYAISAGTISWAVLYWLARRTIKHLYNLDATRQNHIAHLNSTITIQWKHISSLQETAVQLRQRTGAMLREFTDNVTGGLGEAAADSSPESENPERQM